MKSLISGTIGMAISALLFLKVDSIQIGKDESQHKDKSKILFKSLATLKDLKSILQASHLIPKLDDTNIVVPINF